ncbi:MAG: hypothetical protein ACKO1J_15805, partial [Tagaea sp.]
LTRETPMTTRAAAGPLRRSLKGARAVAAAPTYTTTRDTTSLFKWIREFVQGIIVFAGLVSLPIGFLFVLYLLYKILRNRSV